MVDVAPLVICVAERWCRAWKKHRAHPEKATASSEEEDDELSSSSPSISCNCLSPSGMAAASRSGLLVGEVRNLIFFMGTSAASPPPPAKTSPSTSTFSESCHWMPLLAATVLFAASVAASVAARSLATSSLSPSTDAPAPAAVAAPPPASRALRRFRRASKSRPIRAFEFTRDWKASPPPPRVRYAIVG